VCDKGLGTWDGSREQGPQAALSTHAAAGITSHLLAPSSEGLGMHQLGAGQRGNCGPNLGEWKGSI